MPWKLEIHVGANGQSFIDADGHVTVLGYFQPTFLYESIWDIALGFLLLYLTKRHAFGRGNVFALYVMIYTVGRFWIEALRHDHANHILGLRLNDWTSISSSSARSSGSCAIAAPAAIWSIPSSARRVEQTGADRRIGRRGIRGRFRFRSRFDSDSELSTNQPLRTRECRRCRTAGDEVRTRA